MNNLDDAALYGLRALTGLTTGHRNELEILALQNAGAVGKNVNDLWMDFLVNHAVIPQPRGHINSMKYQWMADNGFTGSMNERLLQLWNFFIP